MQRLGGSSSFLPFASARADGVVRAPVSAACVWALRTPLETSRRARIPAHAPQTTLGPPTCVTFTFASFGPEGPFSDALPLPRTAPGGSRAP